MAGLDGAILLAVLGALVALAAGYWAIRRGVAGLLSDARSVWRWLRRRPDANQKTRKLLRPPYLPLPQTRPPSVLLRPVYGVVPFHGRQKELRDLSDWCAGDSPLAVALWVGAGGAGKSRLACELCRTRQEWDWVAGFLPDRISPDDFPTLAATPAPVLVAVDYAEARADDVARLVEAFAAVSRDRAARVLLLARNAGDWWSELPRRVQRDATDARAAVEGADVRGLEELAPTPDERTDVFRRAYAAFAEHAPAALSGAPSLPNASSPTYKTPLFLHLAAMSALEPGVPQTGTIREDLLRAALSRETRIWRERAHAAGIFPPLDEDVCARAVAVATLTVADDENEAAAALESVPDLAGSANDALRRRTVRWLHDLYPGERWFRPLEPDLLGEALVSRVVGDIPNLPAALLAHSTTTQANRVLTVLGRAARDYATAKEALKRGLSASFERIADQVVEVAPQVGDPLGMLAASFLEEQPNPDLAVRLLPSIPWETVALRELRAVAGQQLLGAVEAEADIASVTTTLARDLATLGRAEEALAAGERAVRICKCSDPL